MAKSPSHEEIGGKYPVVYVRWVDSAGSDGWVREEHLSPWRACRTQASTIPRVANVERTVTLDLIA